MSFLLAAFLTPTFSWATPDSAQCLDIFGQPPLFVEQGYVDVYKDADGFSVEVVTQGYIFEAYLNSKKVLSITAILTFPDFKLRSHLKGSELYRQMIEHFGVKNIDKIKGQWLDGTNYDQFFRFISQGDSPHVAAAKTWSGQQATLYGFSHVRLVEIQINKITGRKTVHVEFTRENYSALLPGR